MSYRKQTTASYLCSVVLLAASTLALHGHLINAVGQEVLEVPEIVVEGTTLDSSPEKVHTTGGGTAEETVPGTEAETGAEGELKQRSLPTTGSAVTIVTGEELRAQQIRHAADALRSLPGVAVSRTGAFGGFTQVRIRGGEGNQVQVIIDGIEANNTTDGEFDFGNLLADDIERIEVIRGPQSGLYGSNAVSGVINIITKSGKGPARLTIRDEGGSFATNGLAVNLAGGSDEIHGSATIQNRKTAGFNISPIGGEADGSEITNASFKGGVQIFKWLTLDGVGRIDRNDSERDDQIPNLDRLGLLEPATDSGSFFQNRNNLIGADATATLLNGHWIQHFRGNFNETILKDTQVTDFTFFSQNEGDRTKFDYISTFQGDVPGFLRSHHAVTGLIEQIQENFTPVTDDNIARTRNDTAYALEYRVDFFDSLNLVSTVRKDDNDTFEDFTTYRIAGSFAVPRTPFRLHSSVGTGVKAPTMFEQFGSVPSLGFIPNPNLVPEESFGWDAGVETTLMRNRIIVDATYFDADLTNKIQTLFAPVFTTINLEGVSTRKGEELSAAWQATDRLVLRAAYTHLDAFDPDDLREVRRPEHSGRFDVDYSFAQAKGHLLASLIYNGAMDDVALRNADFFGFAGFEAARITLDAYTLLRLTASYDLRPGVQLFARAENVLDDDYQEVFGFETPGLAAYGGIKVVLGANGFGD